MVEQLINNWFDRGGGGGEQLVLRESEKSIMFSHVSPPLNNASGV